MTKVRKRRKELTKKDYFSMFEASDELKINLIKENFVFIYESLGKWEFQIWGTLERIQKCLIKRLILDCKVVELY